MEGLARISHQVSTRSLFPTRFYLPRPCGRAAAGEAEQAAGPVDALPAKRVRHGWRTLDLRAEQDSEAKQVPAPSALRSENGLNVRSSTPSAHFPSRAFYPRAATCPRYDTRREVRADT